MAAETMVPTKKLDRRMAAGTAVRVGMVSTGAERVRVNPNTIRIRDTVAVTRGGTTARSKRSERDLGKDRRGVTHP